MSELWQVDWSALFVPRHSLVELIVRGSCMYLFLFVLMRATRRQAGDLGLADVLVVVVLADAAQNGMAGEYGTVTEGMVLVLTIVAWDQALDWLEYHSPLFARFAHPPPLPLIRAGKLMRRNLRREMITEDELRSRLREEGVESYADVRLCHLEGDGHISVIRKQ